MRLPCFHHLFSFVLLALPTDGRAAERPGLSPAPAPGASPSGVNILVLQIDQIFDVQWRIAGGTLSAFSFRYIYASIDYDTQTESAARWTAAQTADAGSNGRFISFFDSISNPGTYGMAVYESDGTMYKLIHNTGSFRTLADGAIFYQGRNQWGTLITTEAGYSIGSSGTWTVAIDLPTSTDLQQYQAPAYSGGAAPTTCGTGATCTDVAAPSTGYTCACSIGYDGTATTNQPASCTDEDGCAGVNCGTGATCTDVAAPSTGYTCACDTGYDGTATTNQPASCTESTGGIQPLHVASICVAIATCIALVAWSRRDGGKGREARDMSYDGVGKDATQP